MGGQKYEQKPNKCCKNYSIVLCGISGIEQKINKMFGMSNAGVISRGFGKIISFFDDMFGIGNLNSAFMKEMSESSSRSAGLTIRRFSPIMETKSKEQNG